MAQLAVSYHDDRRPFSVTDVFGQEVDGLLTDEHSQSSYGLPVIVAEDGSVYGPGEIRSIACMIDDAAEIPEILHRAKAAGFIVRVLRRGDPIGAPAVIL